LRRLFTKSHVHSKVILNYPHFTQSIWSSSSIFSKILQMISCTICAKITCLENNLNMVFNMLTSSSFSFGFVFNIEECISITFKVVHVLYHFSYGNYFPSWDETFIEDPSIHELIIRWKHGKVYQQSWQTKEC
jgi:hypothetical protein